MISKESKWITVWSNGPGSILHSAYKMSWRQYIENNIILLIHTKMTTNYYLLDFPLKNCKRHDSEFIMFSSEN